MGLRLALFAECELTERQIRSFITELTELTCKHGIEVDAGEPSTCRLYQTDNLDYVYGVRKDGGELIYGSKIDFELKYLDHIVSDVFIREEEYVESFTSRGEVVPPFIVFAEYEVRDGVPGYWFRFPRRQSDYPGGL